jgi:putative transcriptional regulator
MTPAQLGERAGVTRSTMALEAGKYAPSLLLAFRIARAFVVGVEEVFVREAESRAQQASGSVQRSRFGHFVGYD